MMYCISQFFYGGGEKKKTLDLKLRCRETNFPSVYPYKQIKHFRHHFPHVYTNKPVMTS